MGERGGSVVECRTPEREVLGSRPTVAVLCPWARHFTPRKYWLITQEAMAPSQHDWKIVDWDVKPQHNQLSECEPPHDKTNKMAFVPSEDSDQPGHPPSLIRVFAVRSMGSWGTNVSSCGQQRLWSDWADAQADLCLRWAQWPFSWFCHAAAHVYLAAESLASRASLTADPGVAGSTPARPHIVCWNRSCAFFHW